MDFVIGPDSLPATHRHGRSRLALRELLDPRPAADAALGPIAAAVNIPFAELPQRMHELPPRDSVIGVVGPEVLVSEVVSWLAARDRRAVRTSTPETDSGDSQVGILWRPNAWLAEVVDELEPGRALDLACGTGREAVYLAACGWDVTAIDILPDAIDRARTLADVCQPAIQPITWLVGDIERDPDCVSASYELVTCFRYLHRPLFARLRQWIAPGGAFVGETFTTTHRAKHGKPTSDARALRPGELRELLSGFVLRVYTEDWRADGSHTARARAERPAQA